MSCACFVPEETFTTATTPMLQACNEMVLITRKAAGKNHRGLQEISFQEPGHKLCTLNRTLRISVEVINILRAEISNEKVPVSQQAPPSENGH